MMADRAAEPHSKTIEAGSGRPAHRPDDSPNVALYHPTFLYESLWNVGVFALLILAERHFRLGHGRVFALYVAAYTAGRTWVELLRVDPVNHVFGLRLNVWTSLLMFVGATAYLLLSRRGEAPSDGGPAEISGNDDARTGQPAAPSAAAYSRW